MKVLTVGGAMIDTIAIIESRRIERMTMTNVATSFLLLEEGRKTEALEISTHTGGGAVNAAVALARLGHDVSTLAKLGRDQRAETILARLMQEGVSTRWVVRDGAAPTGASVLVSSHDRNAAVFTFRGANGLLTAADLRDEAFAVDLVHIASLSNESARCFPEIVRRARTAGARVAANPGIRQLSARGGEILDLVGDLDVLALNQVEAETLVPLLVARFGLDHDAPQVAGRPLPRLVERGLSGGGHDLGILAFFRNMSALGCRAVLLTDGGSGAYLGAAGHMHYCPALAVDVKGTAGAGDAFATTFAAVWVRTGAADLALRAATANAASVVGHVDTQTGLLTEAQMNAAVEAQKARLDIRTITL